MQTRFRPLVVTMCLGVAGCATSQAAKSPKELTPEGTVIAKARQRSSSAGDYRVRTASVGDQDSSHESVQSEQQDINVYRDGAHYSFLRVVDVDKDGYAETLCVVSGQFFADGHESVDATHCRKLPDRTVPMTIPLEAAVQFVQRLEPE
jgi:hypothetical protein